MYVVVGTFNKGVPIVRGPFDTMEEASESLDRLVVLYDSPFYFDTWGYFAPHIIPLMK